MLTKFQIIFKKFFAKAKNRLYVHNPSNKQKSEEDKIKIIIDEPMHKQKSEEDKIKIIIDEPRIERNIGFSESSSLLAKVLEHSSPRFTVGIFGGWGTGKTTLMKMIKNEIDKISNEKILTIWFDAWRYENEKHLAVIPFLRTIRLTLEASEKTKTGKWDEVKKGIELTYNAFLTASSLNVGALSIDLEKLINSLKDKNSLESNVKAIYYDITYYLERALANLTENDEAFRVIVFIDDLDRCSPEKAMEVLESIKSFFDIKGIVFVIAMNYKSINSIVKRKFAKDPKITGLDYMEKMVQLSFPIPSWTKDDIREFMVYTIYENISETHHQEEFLNNVDLLITAVKRNPRDVKRFINTIILAKAKVDKPVDELVAIHALLYREEWNGFLEFIIPNEKRKEFLEEYINIKKTSYPSEDFQKRIMEKYDMQKIYSQLNKHDDPLVGFLDAGSAQILYNIKDMNGYIRALTTTGLKENITASKVLFDDSPPSNDFVDYSNTIVNLVKGSITRFSIGIYGEPGSGKTTLMKIVENKLNQGNNDILTVWFNAWQYDRKDQSITIAFLKTISYAMGKHPIFKEINPLLLKAINILKNSLISKLGSAFLDKGTVEFEKDVLSQLKMLAEIDKDTFDSEDIIRIEMQKLILKYPMSRVIVFINDLDTCPAKEILEIFKLVEVLRNIEGFIFIMGLRHDAVSRLIDELYLRDGIKEEDYLRKIIQVPIVIPKWNRSNINSLIENLSTMLDEKNRKIIIENKDLISSAIESNPVMAKRFINNFIVYSQLYPVNHRTLLVLLTLQNRWKDFYTDFTSDSNFRKEVQKYLTMPEDQRTKILISSQYDDHSSLAVKKLIKIDPDLWNFLQKERNIIFGSEEDWEKIVKVLNR